MWWVVGKVIYNKENNLKQVNHALISNFSESSGISHSHNVTPTGIVVTDGKQGKTKSYPSSHWGSEKVL